MPLHKLDGAKIVVCAGAGGVGKTTTSAALGLAIAGTGKRVLVITIDPAKRLADALGLGDLGNHPEQVDATILAQVGVQSPGELWAMMLDPQHTFDMLISELSPDEQTRAKVLENPIYNQISSATGGGHEFTAVTRLYDLASDKRFDVLVLDTPPSRNAIDFLEAPDRIASLLDGAAAQLLIGGGVTGLASRFTRRGTDLALSTLSRLTGAEVLADLANFFKTIGPLAQGVAARARSVRDLLRDPSTKFLIVTSPAPTPSQEAVFLHEYLVEAKMQFAGLVVGRAAVLPVDVAAQSAEEVAAALSGELAADLADRVGAAWKTEQARAKSDADAIADLSRQMADPQPTVVAQLDHDVFDLPALGVVRDCLLAG